MQINSITSSSTIPLVKTASYPDQNPASEVLDSADLTNSANSFSQYVSEASQMPEVRGELVDSYRSRIAAGHYPSQEVIAGLTRLISGPVTQMANAIPSSNDSSSSDSSSES